MLESSSEVLLEATAAPLSGLLDKLWRLLLRGDIRGTMTEEGRFCGPLKGEGMGGGGMAMAGPSRRSQCDDGRGNDQMRI